MENKTLSLINIPGAIIIAGAIIAIALIYVNKPAKSVAPVTDTTQQKDAAVNINLAPVTAADHIFGNPNAPIKIVEYSDPSCSYCKAFNPTMIDIMKQYGPSGKVAWVYRSFPLDTPDANGNILHPNAGNESRALECTATLGGNDKFWEFEKQLYAIPASATGLDQKQLPIIAKGLGIDVVAFNECLSSQAIKDKVTDQALSGTNAGVSGTPSSFFVLDQTISTTATDYIATALVQYRVPPDLLYISADKKIIWMSGAMPKAMVAGIVDSLTK